MQRYTYFRPYNLFTTSRATFQPWNIRYFASEVAGLYDAIKNATEDKKEGLIRLADDEHEWLTGTQRGMQLFVRDCYPGMFDLVSELAKKTVGGGGGVVFTGNPGIGKSWSLNFFLWKLLQEDKTVLFESVRQNTVWLFKDRKAMIATKTADHEDLIDKVRHDLKAWYLFDPAGTTPREPKTIKPFTIVAASPNPQHYKEFFKLVRNKYYVPSWSLEELKKHLPHAAKTVAPGLTEEQLTKYFDIFGGIPRYVYQNEAQAEATQDELNTAIQQLDLSALSLVQSDLEIVQDLHSKLSHKLLQYEVNPKTFKSEGVRFASGYVIEQIGKVKAERYITTLANSIQETTGVLAGDLFEIYAPQILKKGGHFRTYALEPESKEQTGWLTMPPRTETGYASEVSDLKKWNKVPAETFVTCSHNFPVIDALSNEGLFNFTVAKRHGIKGNAGKEVLTNLGVEEGNPVRMFWVVKDGEGPTWRKQPIEVEKESSDKKETLSFIQNRISQFALEVPVHRYFRLDVPALRALCKKKGLSTKGKKAELLSRLEGKEKK